MRSCSRARAPFQSPQSRHWICSDNSLASNPHQIPTLQCFIPKSPETSPSPGLSRTDPLGRSKEEAAQLFATGQTSGWGHIWKQETSQEQRLMGFWESKFKQCAHGPGVIINQSKSGEYVAVFCSYVCGYSVQTAAACRFPDSPQPVLAYELKCQLRYFSPLHLYLLSFVLGFIIAFLPSLSLSETLPHAPPCSPSNFPYSGRKRGRRRHPGASRTEGGHGLRWSLEIF